MINILIADDHGIVNDGLKHVIDSVSDLNVTSEASDFFDLKKKMESEPVDVILMDANMPEGNALDFLHELKINSIEIPILVFTGQADTNYAIRTLKAGAYGYLDKDCSSDELIEAIRTVFDGRKYVNSTISEKLIEPVNSPDVDSPHELLSDREFQVFQQLAEGKPIVDIAENLSISEKTVGIYRKKILEKMDLQTNVDLVRYALDHEIVV